MPTGNLSVCLNDAVRQYRPGGNTCVFGFERGGYEELGCPGFKFQRDLAWKGSVTENPAWFCAACGARSDLHTITPKAVRQPVVQKGPTQRKPAPMPAPPPPAPRRPAAAHRVLIPIEDADPMMLNQHNDPLSAAFLSPKEAAAAGAETDAESDDGPTKLDIEQVVQERLQAAAAERQNNEAFKAEVERMVLDAPGSLSTGQAAGDQADGEEAQLLAEEEARLMEQLAKVKVARARAGQLS